MPGRENVDKDFIASRLGTAFVLKKFDAQIEP